jgi:hypothetical protein
MFKLNGIGNILRKFDIINIKISIYIDLIMSYIFSFYKKFAFYQYEC